MESLYTAIAIFVCWKILVSTSRAELQRIEFSDNIHPRRYNVSSQTNRSEILEAARLKVFHQEEIRRKISSESLNHLTEGYYINSTQIYKKITSYFLRFVY